jgi:4-amino-4-deoxy-L-arabinose transferase-like glycosyltransferase
MVACGALVLALLINAVLIAFRATNGAVHKRHALLLIGLTLVQGLFYSSVTPPWQAPDEHAHYEYAALMGELNRVPSLADVRQDIQAEVTASMFAFDFWRLIKRQPVESPPVGFYRAGNLTEYPPTHVINNRYIYYPQVGDEPPLYYVLPALLYKLPAGQDATFRMYLMRLASVFIWVGLSAAIWWAGQTLFTDRPWLALAALTVAVFNPMLNHIGTVLSNDGLAALWSTLVLGTLTLIFRKGITWRRMLSLSALVVLAILTKKSALWLVPTVALAFLLMPQVPYRWRLGMGLALVGAAVATLALLILPTGEARYWQGGARVPDVGAAGNHVLLVTEGEQVSQRVGRQRTVQVRGQSVVGQARLRSERPSQANVCLMVESSATQCQEISVDEQWRSVSARFAIPDQAERLEFVLTGTLTQQLWVDDVAMATDTGDSLLRNGSVESGVSWLERLLVTVGQPLGIGNLVTSLFANLKPQLSTMKETLPLAWRVFFDSFWGNFGAAMVVSLKSPWPLLTRLAVSLGALGWVLNVIRREVRWHSWQRRVLGMLGLALIFALAQTFLPLLAHSGGWMPQGRFLFPAIWPVVTLLVVGWCGWTIKRTERWFLPCVTLAALALYLGGTWRLVSYFHG